MKSIFHNLVTKEDDFTQLLCNLMERLDDFRASILSLFLPEAYASKITAEQIRIQGHLGEDGRPDIEIATCDLYAQIVVKIDLRRELTQSQKVEPDPEAELKGYLVHLSKRPERERRLLFLVPKHWDSLQGLENSIAHQKNALSTSGVEIGIKYWEDVLNVINHGNPTSSNPFVEEFRNLLAERFGPITFSMEDIHLFENAWHTVRQMQTLIDQIGKKGKALGYTVKTSKTKDEYGIYFGNPGGNEQLFVGMWALFCQEHGFPLCFGVQNSKAFKMPKLKLALDFACKGATKQCHGWTMGWITEEALGSTDSLEAAWAQLAPVLKGVLGGGSVR